MGNCCSADKWIWLLYSVLSQRCTELFFVNVDIYSWLWSGSYNTSKYFLWRFLKCSLNSLYVLKCLVNWTCSVGSFTNVILSFENVDIYDCIGAYIPPEWGFVYNHELFNTCAWTGMLIYKQLFSASVSLACPWH